MQQKFIESQRAHVTSENGGGPYINHQTIVKLIFILAVIKDLELFPRKAINIQEVKKGVPCE